MVAGVRAAIPSIDREVGVHRLPDLLMDLSRASHDVDAVLHLGARGTARITESAAVVLVGSAGRLRVGAIHDEVLARRALLGRALDLLLPGPGPSPFTAPLESGQNALLDVAALAFTPASPAWAVELEHLGVSSLGLTPLLAGDHTVGLLVTCRGAGDDPLTTSDLADQAEAAAHLATFLDTATALTHMRDSSLVVDAMPDAVIAFSRDREVILWNAGAERMYGIAEAEALGEPLDDLVSTEYSSELWTNGSGPAISLINKGSWTGRVRQRTRDGLVLHAEVSIASIVHEGLLRGAVSITRDVSALVDAERQRAEHERLLAHQASHDALTGLRTRRRMEHDVAAALTDTQAGGLPVGVILLDLDRFTDVNDTLGHEVGDDVLVEVAARLRSIPGATSIARLAGDEFAVAIPGVRDRAELARSADHVSRLIAAPMTVGDRELFFGVSLGTALSTDTLGGPDGAANLLRAADTAMYRAKSRGRNSVVAYDEGLRADVERRLQVSSWLNRALERDELHLTYLPQFRCLDGRQTGVEAVLRWRHPQAGEVRAAEFIPVAEESGAIIAIGAWAIAEACRTATGWAALAGSDFSVAVGITPQQLIDPGLADVVRGALLGPRLPASCLTLQVGEGVLVDEATAATEALARLRALGVRIALDDFGRGYSSLAHLSRFPVDELKMDRVFVRDIERDPRTRALAGGIIRIGHALGARVLADGVQAPGQLRILSGMGADGYQGPLAAGPEEPEAVERQLAERLTRGDVPDEIAISAGRSIGWL